MADTLEVKAGTALKGAIVCPKCEAVAVCFEDGDKIEIPADLQCKICGTKIVTQKQIGCH